MVPMIESSQLHLKLLNDILYFPVYFLAERIDRPHDQITYVLGSICSVLGCFLLKNLHAPITRKVSATLMGLAIHFYVFGSTALLSLCFNAMVYMMFLVAPRRHLPLATFVIGGLLLSAVQLHKQIYYYGVNGLDVPMTLMMAYTKLCSLACNIKDGET